MSTAQLHLVVAEQLTELARTRRLREGLHEAARIAGAELTIEQFPAGDPTVLSDQPGRNELPICYRGQPMGRLVYRVGEDAPSVAQAAGAMVLLLEHALDREMAIDDLANAMTTSYEELNMLHSLLSDIAVRVNAKEIGELLIDETARTLACCRVSLLVLDETGENLRPLASRGLPLEAHDVAVPTSSSIAGRTLLEEGLLVVNSIADRPELAGLSRGNYEADAYAIIRVPLNARGEALGVLAATERIGGMEFTARDRKLLEGLSSIGGSALMNCRLHAAVNEQMMSTIRALATAVDAKDHYTHDHSSRVAQLCVATARHLGMTDTATYREVELAGLLHDIGKIGIPDSILSKTERLTPEEYATVKTHAQIGAKIVQHVQGLEGVTKAILHHHERYDGLGYPRSLAGDTIPLAARLISAADTFDTMTSDRPYRAHLPIQTAIRELQRSKGTQHDPRIVDALIEVVNQERGGELSDGTAANAFQRAGSAQPKPTPAGHTAC